MKINIQKVIKCFTCLVTCFMVVLTAMVSPAFAASTILPGCYDPANYIHDITISGQTKTIRYDFSDIRYAFRYWDNDGMTVKDYVDSASVSIGGNASEVAVSCYPFGVVPSGSALSSRGGALYVGDLLPGSPIDFNFSLELAFSWENDGQPFDLLVYYEPGYYVYDAQGNLTDTVNLDKISVTYPLGVTLELNDTQELSGTIPASATYVMPFVRVRSYILGQEQVWVYISFQGLHTGLSVDLSTVLENSNQMQAIKDKLDDIINGTPEQNESADNAADDLGNKKEDIEDLVDQMKPSRPNVDKIDTDINAWAGEEATSLFADGMANILNHPIILAMLSVVAVVSFIGYVLFGKGG